MQQTCSPKRTYLKYFDLDCKGSCRLTPCGCVEGSGLGGEAPDPNKKTGVGASPLITGQGASEYKVKTELASCVIIEAEIRKIPPIGRREIPARHPFIIILNDLYRHRERRGLPFSDLLLKADRLGMEPIIARIKSQ